jgi:hypothetical protein
MTYLKFTICLGLSLVCFGELQAKEWRGIVPLRSTRADVERLLGKENEIGRYQFEDERAFIIYSQGSCDTRAGNCICLISKDVVLEIHVTLEISRQFSDLKVDLSKLERRRERAGSSIFTYSNLDEGVRYSVNESNGEIVGVDYTPAKSDCQALIRVTKTTQPNTWLQLTPLHSSRKEVERVLGPAQVVNRSSSLHRRGTETISIRYVSDSCGSGGWWNVPIDTVEEIQLIPISVV